MGAITGRLIDTTGQLGISTTETAGGFDRASLATKHLNNNFLAAMNTNKGFRDAFVKSGGVVANLSPEWQTYAAGLQSANNAGVLMNSTVLKSIPATQAFGNEIGNTAKQRQMDIGTASAWLAENAKEIDQRGLTIQEIIDTAENMKKEKEVRDSLTAGLQKEMSDRLKVTQANHDTVASYTSSAFAASQSAEANAAISATLDPLIEGQRIANEETRGIQQAYEQLNPATMNQIIAYQKEAQILELGNILKEGSNRATIELEKAQTAGVKSGVEFANSQFLAQASLHGYRSALSEAISGSDQYGDSLGLTTGQLERYLSFQNDVVAAQEAIIESIASVVDAMVVNNRAWETMSQAQLENLAGLVEYRRELITLQQPLADTTENLFKLAEAYLNGMQAANDFILGIRTSTAETEGYRSRLEELTSTLEGFPPLMEKNIANMELFAQAQLGAGQAAVDAGQQIAESWAGLFPAATSILGSLVDAFGKSGKEQRDAIESAWEGLGDDLERLIGDDIKDKFEDMGDGIADLQDGVDAFQIHAFVGEIDKGREVLTKAAKEAKSELPDAWSIAFDEIDKIIATGTPQQINEMMEIIKTGVDPTIVEGQLQKIVNKFDTGGSDAAKAFMAKVNAGIRMPDNMFEEKPGAIPSNIAALSPEPFKPKGAAADPFASIVAGAQSAEVAIQQSIARIQSLWQTGLVANAITVGSQMGNNLGINFNTTLGQNLAITAQMLQLTYTTIQTAATMQGTIAGGNYGLAFNQGLLTALTVTAQMFALTFTTVNAQTTAQGTIAGGNYGLAFNQGLLTALAVTAQMFSLTFTTVNAAATQQGTIAGGNFGLAFNTALVQPLGITAQMFQMTVSEIKAFVTSNPIVMVVDILPAGQQLSTLVTTINSIRQTVIPIISVNPNPAAEAIQSVQDAIDAIKQRTPPPIDADGEPAITVTEDVQKAIDDIKQKNPVKIEADGSQALSEISKVQSELNKLKDVNKSITYTYKTKGTPPKGAQHGWSGVVNDRRSITVGEYGKPEFVSITPLTNPNNVSDKTIDLGRLSSGSAPRHFQQGGNILAVPGGNRDMMRELIEEVRDVKDVIRRMKLQSPPLFMDGKRIDEIQQQRRFRRSGDFG
jgi:hypothetical protein